MGAFSEFQQRSLLSGCMSLSHRVAELEARIAEADSAPQLSGIKSDLSPIERRVVLDYFAHLRDELLRVLEANDIQPLSQQISLRWALQTGLIGMHVAVDELGPASMRGYGELSPEGRVAAERLQQQLSRDIDQVVRLLTHRPGVGLTERLRKLSPGMQHLANPLKMIDDIVSRRSLLEFRPQVEWLLTRLETMRLEVAVCGRVSSGKSSLLNHVAEQEVLPVGILPVTAVPTRLTWGPQPLVRVDFAQGTSQQVDVAQLKQFAAEQNNPQNVRHVARLEVQLPSRRLHEGIVFVDTPGIGLLARSGSAETLAYLPHCDLGIVLIDAASTINEEDIKVIRLLAAAAVPVHVLLSKVDLIGDEERERMLDYIRRTILEHVGLSIPVYPVSTKGRQRSLLEGWLREEVEPLRLRHEQLSRESILKKTVRLAEAVESMLLRSQRNRDLDAIAACPPDFERIARLLQDGDDVLRDLASFASRWREEVPATLGTVFDCAAASLVGSKHNEPNFSTAVRLTIRDVLADHARLIWRSVQDGHAKLLQTLRALAAAAPACRIETGSFQNLPWESLPIADWTPAGNGQKSSRWWLSLPRLIATAAMRQRLERDFSQQANKAVEAYDRLLDRWLHHALQLMRTVYEAQTEIVRGALHRRPAAVDAATANQNDDIEHDIERLREITSPLAGKPGRGHTCSDDCCTSAAERIGGDHPQGAV